MSARILDGQSTAKEIRDELKARVTKLANDTGITPQLAAVIVGDNPASEAYVAMKSRACKWIGMNSVTYRLPNDSTQESIESLLIQLNSDQSIHGILVQHPVPHNLDETSILAKVSPAKDVDGISQLSLGALITGQKGFVCCTPLGIMELLRRYDIALKGKHAVVIGRSIILGKPISLLLLAADCTVTICHSRTADLSFHTQNADILVAAVGRPELITAGMVKPGAIVIDAGYNRVLGRMGDVGDVAYDEVSHVASWITPVPGGVGPMTIAMLLSNTVLAAEISVDR